MKNPAKTAKSLSSQRLFYKLQEVATRWERPVEELLCLALAGDLPVFIPDYGGTTSTVVQTMGYDPNQVLCTDWGVSLEATDLLTMSRTGEVMISRAFKDTEAGLEMLSYSQPVRVTLDSLVIPSEYVESVEKKQVCQLSETERDSLLKMLALCALAAAGDSSMCYHSNGEPNFSQIALQIEKRVKTICPEKIRSRVQWDSMGTESRRKKITEGFDLLLKTKSSVSE